MRGCVFCFRTPAAAALHFPQSPGPNDSRRFCSLGLRERPAWRLSSRGRTPGRGLCVKRMCQGPGCAQLTPPSASGDVVTFALAPEASQATRPPSRAAPRTAGRVPGPRRSQELKLPLLGLTSAVIGSPWRPVRCPDGLRRRTVPGRPCLLQQAQPVVLGRGWGAAVKVRSRPCEVAAAAEVSPLRQALPQS